MVIDNGIITLRTALCASPVLKKIWNSVDKALINPIATITNAKADAIANNIKIKNELNIEELQLTRMQALELKKYQNLENIINKTEKFLKLI